ncbi:MAG: tetratricopeptide repeat protein [Muribaculaceae bacterium]
MKRFPQLLLLLLAVALCATAGNDSERRNQAAAAAKSDVLYYCSQENQDNDESLSAYLQARVAASLNPDNIDAVKDIAMTHLLCCDPKSQTYRDACRAAYDAFMANPDYEYGRELVQLLVDNDSSLNLAHMLCILNDCDDEWCRYAGLLKYIGQSDNRPELVDSGQHIYQAIEERSGITLEMIYNEFMAFKYATNADTAQMINRVRKFVAQSGNNPENLFLAAQMMDIMNCSDTALVYAKRGVENFPDFTPFREYCAKLNLSVGDSVAFMEQARDLILDPTIELKNKTNLIRDIIYTFKDIPAQQDTIVSILGELEDIYPDNEYATLLHATYLLGIDRPEAAIAPLHRALSINKDNIDTYTFLANAYLKTDSIDRVIETMNECYALDPGDVSSLVAISFEFMSRGDFNNGLNVLNAVNEDSVPTEHLSIVYNARGGCYNELGNTAQADSCYRRSLELQPDNALSANNLAYLIVCDSTGNLNEAEELVCRALISDPTNYIYLDTYAWVQFKQRRFADARRTIDLALEEMQNNDNNSTEEDALDPDESDATIYDHAGDIYFMNGLYDDAVALWQKALALKPDDPVIARKVKYKTIINDVAE